MKSFGRIVVCGVGLIGGSFALALKARGLVREVVGLGRRMSTLEEAKSLGVIDTIATGWAEALEGAELVLLAMPVGQMDETMRAMAPHLAPGTLVTDAGSTKRDVIEGIYAHLSEHVANVVPAHPIAGAEKSGPSAARAELCAGRKVVLTPLPENDADAIERVREAWLATGGVLYEMSPAEHDRVFATVSHLPHLLAYALVHDVAQRENAGQLFGYAASGFRDFTRIASSHPEMWRDICVANRHALLGELDAYLAELAGIKALLEEGDGPALESLFKEARDKRDAWLAGQYNI
jgi:prephenate dehydrogenase